MALFAKVAIPLPFNAVFDYEIDPQWESTIEVGKRVWVPVRQTRRVGYVIGLSKDRPSSMAIRPVLKVIDEVALFPKELVGFFQWLSHYYVYPLGKVIADILPFKKEAHPRVFLEPCPNSEGELVGLSQHYKEALEWIKGHKRRPWKSSAKTALELIQMGVVRPCSAPSLTLDIENAPVELNPYQVNALEEIKKGIDERSSKPILLFGVTGSGKTQVYLRAVEYALSKGRSAIVIVPEISLSLYMEQGFKREFGYRLSTYHSKLTDLQRETQWFGMIAGYFKVVLGPRSAVFSPLRDLGIIIVDEEHDETYKQDHGLRYHARDVAVMRARLFNCPVVLGSATPSVQSYYNAQKGKYRLVLMPERVEKRSLPQVRVVDMEELRKRERSFYILSPELVKAIGETLEQKRQSILFYPKRGFFRMLLCQGCGHIVKCLDCDVPLIFHLEENMLLCHHCGRDLPPLDECPYCKRQRLKAYGYGTERLEEEVKALFPTARVQRMDTDAMGKRDVLEVLNAFRAQEIDILVGTHLLTKGYDFPGVTLVGVISSDPLLNFPDFRASERTFQTIVQVSGRAGRGNDPGYVIVQSQSPWHHSINMAVSGEYQVFFEKEVSLRKRLNYPPFCHLVLLELKGKERGALFETARVLRRHLEKALDKAGLMGWVHVHGPVPPPISKLKKLYRFQIMLRTNRITALTQVLWQLRDSMGGTRFSVDVDPYDFL